MSIVAMVFIGAAYLLGSVPTAFLLARWLRDIDIRYTGSGNVGGSNLRATVGLWATVAVGLADIGKGGLPVWLASRAGLDETAATLVGLAAVAGHNWSPWLGFQGGRGIACTLGVLLVRFPIGLVWVLGALALGAVTHRVALLNGLGVLTLPLLSGWTDQANIVTYMTIALVSVMIIKRVEANQGRLALTPNQRRFWVNRLLYDRDAK